MRQKVVISSLDKQKYALIIKYGDYVKKQGGL